MGYNNFLISIALITIFSFAMLNFAVGFGVDNEAEINVGQSDFVEGVNQSIINNAIAGFNTVNSDSEAYEEATIAETSESGTLVTGSPVKNAPKADISTVYNIIRKGQAAIFGEDAGFNTVFTIIISLVGFILLMLGIKAWIGKNPD